MDKISTSLLKEFSQEHDLDRLPEDKRFEHFAAYLAISRYYGETFETSDVVTGASGDTGIDAIGVVVNGALVTDHEMVAELAEQNGYLDVVFILVQAERASNFDSGTIAQFGFGVKDFFDDNPKLPRNQHVADAAEIMSSVYSLSSKFKRGNPVCRLFYVTTGK